MLVSVIIPVYNAEAYVRQAVESALIQPETGEVILIEDASPDGSLHECRRLAAQFGKVRLLRHPDHRNHGPGASRNLGIRAARFDYVAFLDADDFFLPGRFSVAKKVFETDPKAEGVYEAVGVHFETESAKQRWREKGLPRLTTMTKRVPPDTLFEVQSPVGNLGYCSTGGWVVKRSVFRRTGFFDEHLWLHQDTAMFVKFSAVCRMVPGQLEEAVTMRRVHAGNRISAPRSALDIYGDRLLMWATLWEWCRTNLDKRRCELVVARLVQHVATPYDRGNPRLVRYLRSIGRLSLLLVKYPELCLELRFWRRCVATFLIHGRPHFLEDTVDPSKT